VAALARASGDDNVYRGVHRLVLGGINQASHSMQLCGLNYSGAYPGALPDGTRDWTSA
jgi:hypothetical protein